MLNWKYRTLTLLGLLAVVTQLGDAQLIFASRLWLRVWGDSGSVAQLVFGNSEISTAGIDSTAPGEFREMEAPPPPPGFEAVWILSEDRSPSPPVAWRLYGQDWRFTMLTQFHDDRIDTFTVRFAQNDNPSATISFRWPDPMYLFMHCDSIFLIDVSHTLGLPENRLNMMATDTLDVPGAGDSLLDAFRIIKYGVKREEVEVDEGDDAPKRLALMANYPNPFNPATVIGVDVPVRDYVSLKIYDVLGREMTTIFEGILEPGRHDYTWEAGEVAGGVYYYQLSAGGRIQTKSMLLLR